MTDARLIREQVTQAVTTLQSCAARKQKVSIEYDLLGPVRFGWMVSGMEDTAGPAFAAMCRLRDPLGVVHSVALGVKALGPVKRDLADPLFFVEEGAQWLTTPMDNRTDQARRAAAAFKQTTSAYWSDGPPKRMLAAAGSITDQMMLSAGRDAGSPSKPGTGDFRWMGFLTGPERTARVTTTPSHHLTALLAKDRPVDGFHRYALLTALISEWSAWHPGWGVPAARSASPAAALRSAARRGGAS